MDFHPYAQVIRTICTSEPVRSSTFLSEGFNLPTHRSTGFGSPANDLRRAHLAPRAIRHCGHSLSLWLRCCHLNLAIDRNSLARFSKRTIGRWAKPFHALSACSHLVSGSFHLPLRGTFQLSVTLLVCYRSRDVFRVGSLCLPPSRAISDARYSGTSGISLISLPLRDYHPLWCGIPADFGFTFREYQSPNTTSLLSFDKRFGLPYTAFGRPYSRHRDCFLFLRVLRCFNSPRSRSQRDRYGFTVAGGPIRESSVQRLLAPTRGLSQLGTPFISARAKPSTRWRSSSSLRPGCVCITSLEL